jgi:aryl-alcohol dehydrogenase-like predicted oxidoreductase
MRYRTFGKTGIKVSPYALGAMMFGAAGNPDHEDSARIIHTALEAGINFIDTADAYSRGESEEIVGKAIAGRRDSVVLATKFGLEMDPGDPNQRGASRRWIMRAVEDSLRRLGTDYIDLYQMHTLDPGTDLEETISALTDLVRAGKIRAFGDSRLPASGIVEAQWIAERRGLEPLRSEQPPTRSSTAASSGRSCQSPSATAWASWSGARSPRGCSPAASARDSRPTCAAQTCSSTCATSAAWTPSSRSSR